MFLQISATADPIIDYFRS